MKYSAIVLLAATAALTLGSCGNGESTEENVDTTVLLEPAAPEGTEITYYDLSTGTALRKDEATGKYVDEGGKPAEFYVDVQARDTFYGATGERVNNSIINDNNTWRLDESKVKITENKAVIQDDDAKLKVKEDKAKLITDDQKVKVKDKNNDGVNEVKVKNR